VPPNASDITSLATVRALVLREPGTGLGASVELLGVSDFPDAPVRVAVEYSSLNYKDALILSGTGYRASVYPMVPGIDLAGTVVDSRAPGFRAGDRVVLNGAGIGETRWGGYAELASVDPSNLVVLSPRLTTRDAMALGTAGLAAALAVLAIEDARIPNDGRGVLVTGAAGGVGSLSVALLAAHGYRVIASSGRAETHDWLRGLGAHEVIGRLSSVVATNGLAAERWSAAVDTVGGNGLADIAAQIEYGGAIAATGFVGGMTSTLHLAPFLLRSVRLFGINTSGCPVNRRARAWTFLADHTPRRVIEDGVEEIGLDEVPAWAERLLRGQVRGRVVVRPGAAR
jgi:acrylyl-CoA reductase (NADPH)